MLKPMSENSKNLRNQYHFLFISLLLINYFSTLVMNDQLLDITINHFFNINIISVFLGAISH